MIRISVTGPESSGKTSLAKEIAKKFNAVYVPEFSRTYLNKTGGKYQEEDLINIAQGQLEMEDKAAAGKPPMIVCDTDMIVISIWSLDKFGRISPILAEMEKATHYDHYFLCDPEIPWEPDPLRENPNDRGRLYGLYLTKLQSKCASFTEVYGNRKERLQMAVNSINSLF